MAATSSDVPHGTPSPFAAALRDAIAERRLSLAQLHRHLDDAGSPVSAVTLSYWRSGARRPEGAMSLAAVAELERILRLAPHALTDLIGPSHRVGQVRAPGTAISDEQVTAAAAETAAQLGTDPRTWFREVSSVSVAHVGANGGVREHTCRALMQVTTRTVRSVALLFHIPPTTGKVSVPEVYAIDGGTISSEYLHPGGFFCGARFELDSPVTAPETFMMEFGVRIPDDYPPEMYAVHGVFRPSRELVVQVRFPPGVRPAWVHEVEDDEDGELVIPRTMSGSSVHAVRRGFGPGSLGVRWGLDGDEAP